MITINANLLKWDRHFWRCVKLVIYIYLLKYRNDVRFRKDMLNCEKEKNVWRNKIDRKILILE